MVKEIPFDREEFKRDWDSDMTVIEMGEKYNVHKGTITNWAIAMGLPKRKRGRRTDLQKQNALTGGRWVKRGRIFVYEQD